MGLWTLDGKLVVDALGNAINCDHCPCIGAEPVDCIPCSYLNESDHWVNTGKDNLTVTYSGFTNGDCTARLWDYDNPSQSPTWCNTKCVNMNGSWGMYFSDWGNYQCAWSGDHHQCSTIEDYEDEDVYNKPYLWIDSVLKFRVGWVGTYYTDLVYYLDLQLNHAFGSFQWSKVVGNPWPITHPEFHNCLGNNYNYEDPNNHLDEPDCSLIGDEAYNNENCSVFVSDDLIWSSWRDGNVWPAYVDSGGNPVEASINTYNSNFWGGFDCPCDTGYTGTQVGELGPYNVSYQCITRPGSNITATITGW